MFIMKNNNINALFLRIYVLDTRPRTSCLDSTIIMFFLMITSKKKYWKICALIAKANALIAGYY